MNRKRATDQTSTRRRSGPADVGLVLLTRVAAIVGGLAVQSLLAHTLLPEGRGSYAICVMFGALFGAFFSPGADRGIQYYLMSKRITVAESVWLGLMICVFGTALASAVAWPLILSDLRFFQNADQSSFFLSLPLIPLTAFSTSIRLQLAGLRRFARLAVFTVLQTTTNVMALFTLVVLFDWGIAGALVAAAVSHCTMIVAMLRDLHRTFGIAGLTPSYAMLRRVLRYGIAYHVARMGQVVDVQIGAIFLGMVAGRADIGMFAVAGAMLTRVLIIPDAVSSVVLPRVAEVQKGRPEFVSFCGRLTSWVTGIALALLCAVSVPLTRVLLSEPFLPAVRLMWIMAPGIFVYSGTSVLMAYFRGTNRPVVCSWVVWTGLIANLSTTILLYSQVGVSAAAWGMTVGRLCRAAVLVSVFSRLTHLGVACVWVPRPGDARRAWNLGRDAIGRLHRLFSNEA